MKTDAWSEYPADCRNCNYIISLGNNLWWCTKHHIMMMPPNFKYFKDCRYYEKVKVKAEK